VVEEKMNHRPEKRSTGSWVLPGGDPLLWFLTQKLHFPTLWIVVVIVLLTAGITFGAGSIVSYLVYPDASIIRVFDPKHLYYALVVHVVYVPFMWLIYFWQSKVVVDTLTSLREQNVIVDEEKTQFHDLSDRMRRCMNGWYWPVIAVVVVSAVVALQTVVAFPQQASALGKQSFWFYDFRFYWLDTAVWFLSYYVTAMVVIKGMLTLGWFCYLFRKLRVRVDLFHPDGVGGMGALGHLSGRYSAIGIGIGVIAASYTFVRVSIGAGWAYPDAFVLYALYVILTPAALFLPIWSAHERMLEARCQLLSKISAEIDTMLCKMLQGCDKEPPRGWSIHFLGVEVLFRRARDPRDWERSDEDKHLETLQARYKLIMDIYPTWPIRISLTRNLTIVGILPLVTGIVGLISKF
jgi:hypothetical protein